jgi:hypothetical protein
MMAGWRDELSEVIKTKDEREVEEAARKRKRLVEALGVGDEALERALEGLKYAHEQLQNKSQPSSLSEQDGVHALRMHEQHITIALQRDDAILKVVFNDGRPREFDFAQDRHMSPKDVEEYVGRRAVEFARAAQKTNPW